MKSVIELLNKCNYSKRRIHDFGQIQDGILFAQLEDEFFKTDLKQHLWNLIITHLQRIRRNHNLYTKEFKEDIANSDCNEELAKFIKYFLETIFYVNKEEAIYYMKQCTVNQQEEIVQFLQNDLLESNSLQDLGPCEFQTTNTIISLEENLYSKDNIIIQQTKQIEQLKYDYQNILDDMKTKIDMHEETIDKLTAQANFFLEKVICDDFEEACYKFQEFAKDQEKNKKQIEELNNLVQNQQTEILNKRKKNQKLKSQLSSNQPTERASLDYETTDQKDSSETRTIELLKKEIQNQKDENLKLLSKQAEYEQQISKFRKKLYEQEQETAQYKKKMEKYKLELDDYLNSNQEKRTFLDNHRPQGLLSSNTSQIIEIEQKFGVSPQLNGFDINQSLIRYEHPVSYINQSFKSPDENNVAKLQLQIAEKNNKIANLEKQINVIQHGTHSRGGSLTKFTQMQQERHAEYSNLLENIGFYIQYTRIKDQEVKQIKEQQNENFQTICRQLIQQNRQIQKLNALIFEFQNQEQVKENSQTQNEDPQNLHQYYMQALNDKDKLLQLITTIFYEHVKI
ncbi:unnamed protein product (macronuclear) [Paramecium tetraurelia]|uniref:Uncharacterized protein n=1 Tax=Paramecium tetraurelia TaxID=5888 RepID=A0E7Y7_PARTE|nr:uncharacterized protein GSPATT00024132001 [Paramecium tetraurelia]CAK91404.1 unnamed protein product [Paramecium tetraurelia]|eukprot:XP_001458801.1 hypothetical protein (macronuclear) [Paramecium tetraurelia strain d4-2]